MENNSVYTAKLTFTTTGADPEATHIVYEWDPPFDKALAEAEGNPYKLPSAYQHMAHLLQTAVFPNIAMNETYEAEFLDEPTVADILEELNAEEETAH